MKLLNWITTSFTGTTNPYANPDLPSHLNIHLTTPKSPKPQHISLNLSDLTSTLNNKSLLSLTCEDILTSSLFQSLISPYILDQTHHSFFLIDNTNHFTQLKLPLTYKPYRDLYQTTNALYYIALSQQQQPSSSSSLTTSSIMFPPLFHSEPYYNLLPFNDDRSSTSSSSRTARDVLIDNCLFLDPKNNKWLKEKIMLNEKKVKFTYLGMESSIEIEKIRQLHFGMKTLLKIEPNLNNILLTPNDSKYILGFTIQKRTCIFIIKNNYDIWIRKFKEFRYLKNEIVLEKKYNEVLLGRNISIGIKIRDIIENTFDNKEQFILYEFYRNYYASKLKNKLFADFVDNVLEYKVFHLNNNLLYSWSVAKKLVALMKLEKSECNGSNNSNDGDCSSTLVPKCDVDKLNDILGKCEECLKVMDSQTPEDMYMEFNNKLKDVLVYELFDDIVKCLDRNSKGIKIGDEMRKYVGMFYFLKINKNIRFLSIKSKLEHKRKNK